MLAWGPAATTVVERRWWCAGIALLYAMVLSVFVGRGGVMMETQRDILFHDAPCLTYDAASTHL